MYIIKNAWKSIVRNKGRNILIMIIVLVIAVAACVSLSIREAAKAAKEDTLAGLSVTAQLSFNRTFVMQDMRNEMQNAPDGGETEPGGFDRGKFDFSMLQGSTLTLDDYLKYAALLSEDDGYYYTLSTSMNARGELVPYGEEESAQAAAESSEGRPGMAMEQDFGNSGDFNVTGYSSYSAMVSLFGEDGTCAIVDGTMFTDGSAELTCIISNELAMYNEDLAVGSTIILANPANEEETYTLTVVGIYQNSASDEGNSRFSVSDPANNIYMSEAALQVILNTSAEANATTDGFEEESGTALAGEISFTYVLASVENYEAFTEAATALGLPENYTISSPDISAYENSLTPLETLSTMTVWFFVIVLVIGGVILVVINVFNLRERKYEVGVLTAIGMKKSKVALQFICELFIITFAAIVVGAGTGAAISVPVANTLLEQQIEKAESSGEQLNQNFGMPGGGVQGGNMPGNMMGGNIKGESQNAPASYVQSVSSATNLTVILEMVLVGILLTIISGMAAMITIMRYEPLRILSDRS